MQLQSIASILCLTPNAVKMWCIVSLPVECGDTLCLCKPNVVTHIVSLRVLRSVDVLLQTVPCGSRLFLIIARFEIQTTATAAADGDHADDGGDDNDDDQKGIAKLLPSSDLQITMYND